MNVIKWLKDVDDNGVPNYFGVCNLAILIFGALLTLGIIMWIIHHVRII